MPGYGSQKLRTSVAWAGPVPALRGPGACRAINGAIAERKRFTPFEFFTLIWATVVYDPIAPWVCSCGADEDYQQQPKPKRKPIGANRIHY